MCMTDGFASDGLGAHNAFTFDKVFGIRST